MKTSRLPLAWWCFALVICSGCAKETPAPQPTTDSNDIKFFLQNQFAQDSAFAVYIYSPPTDDLAAYSAKTTSKQVYFGPDDLRIKPSERSFPLDRYLRARIVVPGYSADPARIQRMEIYFK